MYVSVSRGSTRLAESLSIVVHVSRASSKTSTIALFERCNTKEREFARDANSFVDRVCDIIRDRPRREAYLSVFATIGLLTSITLERERQLVRRPRRRCARQANRPGVRRNERIEKTIAKRARQRESKERHVDWRAGLSYAAAFSLVISTVYFLFSLIFDRIKPVTCATLRTPPPVQTWACQGVRVERTSCVYVWVCVWSWEHIDIRYRFFHASSSTSTIKTRTQQRACNKKRSKE